MKKPAQLKRLFIDEARESGLGTETSRMIYQTKTLGTCLINEDVSNCWKAKSTFGQGN